MLKQTSQKQNSNFPSPKTIGEGIKKSFSDLLGETSQTLVNELKEFPPEVEKQLGIKVETQTRITEQSTLIELSEARKIKEAERKEEVAKQEVTMILTQISQMRQKEKERQKIEIEQTIEVTVQAAKENKIDTKLGLLRVINPGLIVKNLVERLAKETFKKVQDSHTWSTEAFKRMRGKRPRGMLIWTQDQKRVTEAGATMLQG